MFDLILFDLDGTLVNSEKGITRSVKYALDAMGIKEEDRKKLRSFIGPPLVDSFMDLYEMDKEQALEAVKKYRERYSDIGVLECELIDGIKDVLKTLKNKGKKLALATSKPHIYARRILEEKGIIQYFEILVGAEFDGTRNDKKDVIAEVLKQADGYKNAIMVGDRFHDIVGAKKNNICSVGVEFGFAEDGEFQKYGADFVAETCEELLNILLV